MRYISSVPVKSPPMHSFLSRPFLPVERPPDSIPLDDPFHRRVYYLESLHRMSVLHASQAAAAASLTGMELLEVKEELRKSASGGGFLDWFRRHQEDFGFSERTKDKYMKLARRFRRKMPPDIAFLLTFAPSDLSVAQQARLIAQVEERVDGKTLNELYIESGIIRRPPGDLSTDMLIPGATYSSVMIQHLVQVTLYEPILGKGKRSIWKPIRRLRRDWDRPTRDGDIEQPLWRFADEEMKHEIVRYLKAGRDLIKDGVGGMIAQLEEAIAGETSEESANPHLVADLGTVAEGVPVVTDRFFRSKNPKFCVQHPGIGQKKPPSDSGP